jgi:hypothetical protein
MPEMTPEEALSLVRCRLEDIDEELRKGSTKAWLRTAIGDVWRYLDPDADWGRALLHRPKVLAEGWGHKDVVGLPDFVRPIWLVYLDSYPADKSPRRVRIVEVPDEHA